MGEQVDRAGKQINQAVSSIVRKALGEFKLSQKEQGTSLAGGGSQDTILEQFRDAFQQKADEHRLMQVEAAKANK